MKRTQIYFTDRERLFFKSQMKTTGLTMAEIVRRIVDIFIENQDKIPRLFSEQNEKMRK